MLRSAHSALRFDAFILDPVRCTLMRGSSELPLRQQTFEVLRYLAEHAGEVVSSDALVAVLWSSKPADHNASVGQCIKEIRRAIGDDARWIIKTVSGRGYEFKAEVVPLPAPPSVVTAPLPRSSSVGPNPRVEMLSDAHSPSGAKSTILRQAGHARLTVASSLFALRQTVFAATVVVLALGTTAWLLRPTATAVAPSILTMMPAPTIAVLPFKAIGPPHGDKHGTSGLADELLSALSRAHLGFGLTVKSAADFGDRAFEPKKDGPGLGVRYAVLGSTSLDRDIQHANIQLLELGTNTQIWSEMFDINPAEPRAVERIAARMARLVAFHVMLAESRRPVPEPPEAGHFVIAGRAIMEGERGSKLTRDALVHFEKAFALDSKSINALHGVAALKIDQVRNGWIPWEDRPAALDDAEAAIERIIKIDHRNVGAHFLRGFLLRARGDVDHAIAALEHALTLNPNFSSAMAQLGRIKVDAGRAREGLQDVEEAIRMSPTDPAIQHRYFFAGMAAVHVGDDQTAVTWLLKARQANRYYAPALQFLAVAYLGAGDEEKARSLFAEYLSISPGFSIDSWERNMASRNLIVIEQRKRIVNALRHLGAPEGKPPHAQH